MMLPQPDVACAGFANAGPVTRIPVEGRCHESVLAAGSRVKFPRNSFGNARLEHFLVGRNFFEPFVARYASERLDRVSPYH